MIPALPVFQSSYVQVTTVLSLIARRLIASKGETRCEKFAVLQRFDSVYLARCKEDRYIPGSPAHSKCTGVSTSIGELVRATQRRTGVAPNENHLLRHFKRESAVRVLEEDVRVEGYVVCDSG